MCRGTRFPDSFVIGTLVLFLGLASSADDKQAKGTDLINRWNRDQDLRAAGSSPFHLTAKFELLGMSTGTVAGTWDETFLAPDQWRLQIDFPGYQEIIIRNGPDRYWRKLSSQPAPLRIGQMKDLLGFKRPVRVAAPNYKIDEVRDRKVEGQNFTCVRRKWESAREERCFDKEGHLARVEHPSDRRIEEYSNFADFNGKPVATKMRLMAGGSDAVHVEGISIERYSGPAESVLTPDSSFEVRAACDAVTGPKLEHAPDPSPPDARSRGTVVLVGEVGLDGRVHHPAVLQTAGAALDQAALDAVRNWKFKPANCNGVPIPFELNVEVNFRGVI